VESPRGVPYRNDGEKNRKEKKRTPKRYQDSVLCGWLEIFSTLRNTNSETKLKVN